MSTHLKIDDPRYGPVCPNCDGPKSLNARQCMECLSEQRRGGDQVFDNTGIFSENAVHTVGRREALITFARDDKTRTVHCFDRGTSAQIADGRAQLKGDGWEVASRSTPTTILADLRIEQMTHTSLLNRVHSQRRAAGL
jgi:hypothetical protein